MRSMRLMGSLAVAAVAGSVLAQPVQRFKLLAADGADSDEFGQSVAVRGGRVLAGAWLDDDLGNVSGSAYLFGVDTGTETAKLLPDDGYEGAWFGRAVALTDTLAVVGAPGDTVDGTRASVYLFDLATGQQTGKLSPVGGSTYSYFGYAVGADGTTAVVGAPEDWTFEFSGGAAHLFDLTTGQHLARLDPPGTINGDRFGDAVAISGDLAVIGAPGRDAGGTNAGAAYVFRVSTGALVAELLAADAEDHDYFGQFVAIEGETVLVGAPYDDDFGNNTGGAYLFDALSGRQTAKLLPSDGIAEMWFGSAVGLSGGTALVGAERDPHVRFNQGSAYLFDAVTGAQRAKLTASDGMTSDVFGHAAAIDGTTVVVSAPGDDDAGNNAGSAYVFGSGDPDTDGDGLLDSWENEGGGIDINGDGTIDLDLYAMGARPDHKDLFLEVDVMNGGVFSQAGLNMVVDSFRFAPVENPDGNNGVELHVTVDELDIPYAPLWDDEFHDFDNIKAFYFGTLAERADGNAGHILAAKRKAFRYCILVDEIADATLGIAELPGNDMYLGLGGLSNSNITELRPFEWWFAHVFMHELGHLLGLEHGGEQDPDPFNPGEFQTVNYKPNYVSVMNYNFDHVALENDSGDWVTPPVTYSGEALPVLVDNNLDETIGIASPTLLYTDYWVPFTKWKDGVGFYWGWAKIDEVGVARIDYNGDGDTDDTGVVSDLNFLWAGSTYGEIMGGHNDWANLQYAIGEGGDWDDYVHTPLEEPELSDAMATERREQAPPPPFGCRADVNLDRVVDTRDVLAFLNLFAGGKGAADFNLDGQINTLDVLAFLNDWVAGCP